MEPQRSGVPGPFKVGVALTEALFPFRSRGEAGTAQGRSLLLFLSGLWRGLLQVGL